MRSCRAPKPDKAAAAVDFAGIKCYNPSIGIRAVSAAFDRIDTTCESAGLRRSRCDMPTLEDDLAIDDEYYDETDNELNLLDFRVGPTRYCINILKIREILALKSISVIELPDSDPSVLGIFQLRDLTIPLVDLEAFFKIDKREDGDKEHGIVLVCEFNEAVTGFLVKDTGHIHRLTWDHIRPIEHIGKNEGSKYITSRVDMDGDTLLMLDFERIFAELNGNPYELEPGVDIGRDKASLRSEHTVYFAEDSSLIRDIVVKTLKEAGYADVVAFEDGESAYDAFREIAEKSGGDVDSAMSLLVTDIEMPRMDGLTLCRKIRKDLRIADLPIIVFSSMISDQMAMRCKDVGATEHIAKPKKEDLLKLVDKYCLGRSGKALA